jgi:hypothetical protein
MVWYVRGATAAIALSRDVMLSLLEAAMTHTMVFVTQSHSILPSFRGNVALLAGNWAYTHWVCDVTWFMLLIHSFDPHTCVNTHKKKRKKKNKRRTHPRTADRHETPLRSRSSWRATRSWGSHLMPMRVTCSDPIYRNTSCTPALFHCARRGREVSVAFACAIDNRSASAYNASERREKRKNF